ncbi:hypothetical protein ODZ83_02665 [Acaricomes phytoseiuli]|uniref:hypothetical protein n=1 Tax=Acaricomes phytoseiuli TaxID=291968 RepID=UPI00036A4DAE|nr:hypothetical protein [Acaricomes phytoseiuli]MCW1249101.1 hypothetical protein [Acaricomes phytoseiuli]
MDFVKYFLVFLHILGAAAIVGAWFVTFKKPTVLPIQLWGAILQLVTGLALVGIAGATRDPNINYIKITVKLVITIAVLIPAIIGYRKAQKGEPVSTGLAHAVGGMAVINIAVATLWS